MACSSGRTVSYRGVRRVTQTDYYVVIQIRDARTGKLSTNRRRISPAPRRLSSGVRMLIKHQVLASQN